MADKVKISVEDHTHLMDTSEGYPPCREGPTDGDGGRSWTGDTLPVGKTDSARRGLPKCCSFPRIQCNSNLTSSRTTLWTLDTVSPRVSAENIFVDTVSETEAQNLHRSLSDRSMDTLPPLDSLSGSRGTQGSRDIPRRRGMPGYHRSASCPAMHSSCHMTPRSVRRANQKTPTPAQEESSADHDMSCMCQNTSQGVAYGQQEIRSPASSGNIENDIGQFINIGDLSMASARQAISGLEDIPGTDREDGCNRKRCEQWLDSISPPGDAD